MSRIIENKNPHSLTLFLPLVNLTFYHSSLAIVLLGGKQIAPSLHQVLYIRSEMGHHQSKPKSSNGYGEVPKEEDNKREVGNFDDIEKEGAGEWQMVCPFQEGLFKGSAHAQTEHDSHLTQSAPQSPRITSKVFEKEKVTGGCVEEGKERKNGKEYGYDERKYPNIAYYEACLNEQRKRRKAAQKVGRGESGGHDGDCGGGDRKKRVILPGRKTGGKGKDEGKEVETVCQG